MSSSLRILIVEDQSMFRDFMFAQCRTLYPNATIERGGSADEARKLFVATTPTLILLDINLPDSDGIVLGEELIKLSSSTRILAVSAECTEALWLRLSDSKLSGFYDKNNETVEGLAFAIDEVLAGRPYYSDSILAHRKTFKRQFDAWPKLLSDTEQDILPYLGANIELPLIAAVFAITEDTVLWHRKNIKHKLEVKTDSDLMHFCATKGFVLYANGKVRPLKMS
jgi:DNA-binding NarL/FixJ family response regulator